MRQPEIITSRSDPAIQRLMDISKPAFKPGSIMFLEDEIPVREAILSGAKVVEVYADENHSPRELMELCASRSVPFRFISASLMSGIFKAGRRPDVVGVAVPPRPARLEQIDVDSGDVLILDGVRIVGNIGAIVRSALALKASGVVLCDSQLATVMDRRLVRASRGFVFSLPVVLADAADVVRWAKPRCRIVRFAADGDVPISELTSIRSPLALVLGSELRGVSSELGAAADLTASIQMRTGVESLNVSVAAGIALFVRSEAR
ncbi:TrmH family RNA methyltransferase [Propionibacterium sp. oral taxon 192]|uniref:TrmH family RNA methyltransferase n=1 Tax=Propionibacterium sp. oral taxon 192 TaxID=671222 RepID=UPI0003A8E3B0|nr:TrmH family RNA methyltransferase [Propionibacterium sp. oral taxon 192]